MNDPVEIRLLANFIHEQLFQMLWEQPMTEAQLSAKLGLTRGAIGYHLNQLKKADLIYLTKIEPEKHGILQKFYSPIASCIIIDYNKTPDPLKRYFIQKQIEHLRGVLTVLKLSNHFSGITSENLEKFAVAMLKQLKITCKNYEEGPVGNNVEDFKIKIYAEALENLFDPNEQLDSYNTIAKHIRKLLPINNRIL